MEMTVLLWILAAVLVTVGMAGLFLPAIPGALMLFAGLVIAAWADDFTYAGVKTLTALGVLACSPSRPISWPAPSGRSATAPPRAP
jgi:uncharacterized protein YqgC (DUF456 family)